MSYLNIDMNEDNYNYEDLLELFALDSNFNQVDLRVAKRKVMKLHPDRSTKIS